MNKIRPFFLGISILFFISSLEPLIFSSRHHLADGYNLLYMASSFIDSVNNFWTYAPPPAPSYFPEITILYITKLFFPFLKDWHYIAITNLFICLALMSLLIYVFPKIISKNLLESNTKIFLNKDTFQLYVASIFFIFSLLNFISIGTYSTLWIDGAGDNTGASLIALITILFILHKKINFKKTKLIFIFFLMSCLLGFFSDRILVVSVAFPLIIILFIMNLHKTEGRWNFNAKHTYKYLFLVIFSFVSFIPNIIFSEFEVSDRHQIPFDFSFLIFEKINDLYQNKLNDSIFQTSVFSVITLIIIITSIKNYRNFIALFAILSLFCVLVALAMTDAFRGWNFRYFSIFFFVGLLTLMYLKKITLLAISLFLFISTCFVIYDHNFVFEKNPSREFMLAECIKKNNLNNDHSYGISGHWDTAPINYYLEKNVLVKARLNKNKISLHHWMINSSLNKLNKPFNFIVVSPLNSFYGFNQRLKEIDGFKKSILCEGTRSEILLFKSPELRKYFNLPTIIK